MATRLRRLPGTCRKIQACFNKEGGVNLAAFFAFAKLSAPYRCPTHPLGQSGSQNSLKHIQIEKPKRSVPVKWLVRGRFLFRPDPLGGNSGQFPFQRVAWVQSL